MDVGATHRNQISSFRKEVRKPLKSFENSKNFCKVSTELFACGSAKKAFSSFFFNFCSF